MPRNRSATVCSKNSLHGFCWTLGLGWGSHRLTASPWCASSASSSLFRVAREAAPAAPGSVSSFLIFSLSSAMVACPPGDCEAFALVSFSAAEVMKQDARPRARVEIEEVAS